MKIYIRSTKVESTALSKFDPIRKMLGEDEWYKIEEYLINGDKEHSLKEILYDEDAWDDYADWKMRTYHEKPAIAASTRIKARKYLKATTVKAAAEGDYNKLIKRIDQDGYTCFIIQSGDEPDYWYWCVDTFLVDRYKGTDQEFINDYDNSSEGSSCASFATPEEAEKDFLGE